VRSPRNRSGNNFGGAYPIAVEHDSQLYGRRPADDMFRPAAARTSFPTDLRKGSPPTVRTSPLSIVATLIRKKRLHRRVVTLRVTAKIVAIDRDSK